MINPVIYTFHLFGYDIPLRWYGVIVMVGVVVGSLLVERELKRRGEKGDLIWDALVWVLPVGIIGARLWYVFNADLGGNQSYFENPASIFKVWEGGLHIFGGFLFGAVALLVYLRLNHRDPWLFLDAAGPAALIGQGIGRLANFINQELYGPPTMLPWGIPISADHRLPQFANLPESTRFHPTFAYEMLWNFASASLLLWLSHRYEKDVKPGALFSGWLVLAGLGRVIIEFFRPDQPKIPALGISYSSIVAALMAIVGAVLLLVRYRILDWAPQWEEEYQVGEIVEAESGDVELDEATDEDITSVKRTSTLKVNPSSATRNVKEASIRRTRTKKD